MIELTKVGYTLPLIPLLIDFKSSLRVSYIVFLISRVLLSKKTPSFFLS